MATQGSKAPKAYSDFSNIWNMFRIGDTMNADGLSNALDALNMAQLTPEAEAEIMNRYIEQNNGLHVLTEQQFYDFIEELNEGIHGGKKRRKTRKTKKTKKRKGRKWKRGRKTRR